MDNSTRWREAQERASHLQKYKGSAVWCNETIGQMAKRLAEEKPDISVFPNIEGDWSYKRIYDDALALAQVREVQVEAVLFIPHFVARNSLAAHAEQQVARGHRLLTAGARLV